MCGEHNDTKVTAEGLPGSSPHVRGAPIGEAHDVPVAGIIPACAGSTRRRYARVPRRRDHPRMCGEHAALNVEALAAAGSSPHVRGAPFSCGHIRLISGIIPACAGSTPLLISSVRLFWDHPRMCGEHLRQYRDSFYVAGSSPHVRGARVLAGGLLTLLGIIPACAGSTGFSKTNLVCLRDHPRMCGEHMFTDDGYTLESGSSPHVRGARFVRWFPFRSLGIIPACAGSTSCARRHSCPWRDHPRMCGEHPFENSIIPRKRKDNWLFSIQFRFENFLAFRYLLALLHPFLGVPTKDPSFASLGRLINCNPSQSTGDQSAPYTLKAICCSFLAE